MASSAGVDIVAGSIGGMAQVVTGYPLDTVKVRLQSGAATGGGSMLGEVRSIFASQGVGGFFRGIASPLAGAAGLNSLLFFVNGASKQMLFGDRVGRLQLHEYMGLGFISGAASALIEGPVDLFKCKLQAPGAGQSYTGVSDCARDIISRFGLRGCFQGFGPTLIRNSGGYSVYFGIYEALRTHWTPASNQVEDIPAYKLLIAGGAAGVGFWSLLFPFDVIKSTMQTDASEYSKRRHPTMLATAARLHAQGGISAFFRGFVPCVVRSFPANAACFVGYEYARRALAAQVA